MKVLLVHNQYQERGGEDSVLEAERDMLASHGIEVASHVSDNHAINSLGGRIRAFAQVANNPDEVAAIMAKVREGHFDLIHVHNFLPLVSPAFHEAVAAAGLPVVQTLHNYRLLCANGMLMREDRICEDCLGGSRHHALWHRCYRGSLAGSLAVLRMQDASIRNPRWVRSVSRFIALTQFAKAKFAAAGLPAERIAVKPNSAPDPGQGLPFAEREGALFVGRIAPGKGVPLLVEAWRSLPDIALTIVGTGPELEMLRAIAPANVSFAGHLAREEVFARMKRARFLVLPSTWYEGFPVTLVEALACGLPAIASRLGCMPELIRQGDNGFLFTAGDSGALSEAIAEAFSDKTPWDLLSANARASYEQRYSPATNIAELLAIYEDALGEVRANNR